MSKTISLFSVLLLLISTASAQLLNPNTGMAFKVGSKEFTKSKIDSAIQMVAYQQGRGQALPPQAMAQLKYSVIQDLIVGELLRLEAENLKIKASKGITDTLKLAAAAQFGGSEAKLKEQLKKSGMSEKEFDKKIAEQAKVETLVRQVTPERKDPTEKDMLKFFEDNRKLFPVDDSISGVRIILNTSAKDSKDDIADKTSLLQGLAAQIKLGKADVRQLAAMNSDEADARKTGGRYIGSLSKMPKPFADAVKKVKVGGVSDVFKTNEGLQIFFLEAKNDGKYESYKQRIQMNLMMMDESTRQQKLAQYVQGLIKKHPVVYYDSNYELPSGPQGAPQ